MTQRIFKYESPIAGSGIVETPAGATLLAAVHAQGSKPCLWFIVEPDDGKWGHAKAVWEVYIAVTGEELPPGAPGEEIRLDEARYLGTFQIAKEHPFGGSAYFVGHVFVFVPPGHNIRAAGQAAEGR